MLFHISERSDISRFDPRPSEYVDDPVVWAIDGARLCNYLVPRDCPRVTYYANQGTSDADVAQFLRSSRAVVAVESVWWEKLRSCNLFCYHLTPESFVCIDECAGYFVSRIAVAPARIERLDDPIAELLNRGVELRLLPDLWSLRDAVVGSTLQYSIIRMRNAKPRVDLGKP